MRESVIHSTENNNLYLYDAQHKFSVLMHPDLGKVHEKSIGTDSYYVNKYTYLKKYGFFGKSEPVDFETILDEAIIKEKIIQIQRLVFEVTDHCNLNCMYCRTSGKLYKFGRKKKDRKKNISIRYAVNLLKYIFDLKLKNKSRELHISFYGGEPLVKIQLIKQIVETAYQLNSGKELELGFAMTTNATLIHQHIHFLVEHNFQLLISLDGDEEGQSYRTFAKDNKNSFRQVIENIDMIQRDFPAYFAEHVDFNAVLHNRNSVKSIYEFVYNRYHKIPKISQLNRGEKNSTQKDLFERMFVNKRKSEEEYLNKASDLVPGTREELIFYKELGYFIKDYSINFHALNLLFLLYGNSKRFPTGTCVPFSKKMFLSTCHNLLPCEKIINKYSLGKVNENVIIDIPEIARKFNVYYEHFKKICQHCYSCRSCGVCLLTIEDLDKLDTEEFVCFGFQNQEAFKKKLNRMLSKLEKEPNLFFK